MQGSKVLSQVSQCKKDIRNAFLNGGIKKKVSKTFCHVITQHFLASTLYLFQILCKKSLLSCLKSRALI